MKNKFTPGSYLIKQEGHYFRNNSVFGSDGKQLMASVYGANQEQVVANAQLFFAAPDLLEALEEYISVSDDTVAFEYPEIFKRATDAIKKARGI